MLMWPTRAAGIDPFVHVILLPLDPQMRPLSAETDWSVSPPSRLSLATTPVTVMPRVVWQTGCKSEVQTSTAADIIS